MKYQIKDIDSKSELEELFRRVNSPKLLIQGVDSPNRYKLMTFDSLTVGLIDHNFGIPVQIGILDDNLTCLVGHESELNCLSLKSGAVLWKAKLDSVFFEFKKLEELNYIVIIQETGVVAFDFFGKKLWSVPTEIITECQIVSSNAVVKTIDERVFKIEVLTGKVLA